MITNKGVEIISKYLVGQASSYGSHIAVGSGARPTSNSQGITIVPSGMAVGTVTGSGPYVSTLSLTGSTANDYFSYLKVGDTITATSSGGGSLGSGTVTVTSINGPKQIGISSTATMTSGVGLTNLTVYSSLTSQSLTDKTSLDFEVARFPIVSRSYIVEKQTVTPTSLFIISPTQILCNIASGHPFAIGDVVNISDVAKPTSGAALDEVVDGAYTISAISSTTFTADVAAGAITNWDSSLYGIAFVGKSYNSNLFNATVFTKQVSLTAEMSDTSRYEFSELGLYSLGSNQYSTSGNSRILLTFAETEGWQHYLYHATAPTLTDITNSTINISSTAATAPSFCSTTDAYWNDTYVSLRQEKPRILSDGLIVPGALSNWDGTALAFLATSDYLLLADPGINLSKSSGTDEVRLAYSVMNAVSVPTALPTELRVQLEFTCSNGIDNAKLLFSNSGATVISPNRYEVITKNISDIVPTAGFDWSKVTSLKVYASLEASGTPTDDYAIVLDGLRFENVGTENPLYALTAYTPVNNVTATTVTKEANSNDLINFRVDLAVGK